MPNPRNKKSGFMRRLLPSRLVRRFVRQQDGSAAVEFSMVAIPFLGLTFAILETALVFFAGQTLETAVTDSARLIMTGQAQTGGWSKEDFKNAVCAHAHVIAERLHPVRGPHDAVPHRIMSDLGQVSGRRPRDLHA